MILKSITNDLRMPLSDLFDYLTHVRLELCQDGEHHFSKLHRLGEVWSLTAQFIGELRKNLVTQLNL